MHTEDWLEFMLRRAEELARRLIITHTPPLSAAARHYVSTNLYAPAIEEVEAGAVDSWVNARLTIAASPRS